MVGVEDHDEVGRGYLQRMINVAGFGMRCSRAGQVGAPSAFRPAATRPDAVVEHPCLMVKRTPRRPQSSGAGPPCSRYRLGSGSRPCLWEPRRAAAGGTLSTSQSQNVEQDQADERVPVPARAETTASGQASGLIVATVRQLR